MRVDTRLVTLNTSPTGAARRSEAGQAFASQAFAPSSPGASAAGASATPAASLAGLDAILTLQSNADTPEERRRRSARRGNDLLDGLDRLKAALLNGRVAPRDLQAIAARLNERAGLSGDPRLDGLIAEIELRAAVELAKLSASAARAA